MKVYLKIVVIVSASLFFTSFMTFPAHAAFNTNCSDTATTGIPESECNALGSLYNSTNGDSWTDNTNWGTDTAVSTWHGITVASGHVSELDLHGNNLVGTIPLELENLNNLEILSVWNNQLTGSIPSELGNLSNLRSLYIDNNQLTGSIPSELGNLSNLQILHAHSNQLTGSIPSELGNLSNLTELWLDQNQLSGSIPSELGNLSNLRSLSISNNQLTGSIPSELGNLSNLDFLNAHSNQLTGSIPSELGNLTNLTTLSILNNRLSGSIPSELGNLTNLTVLKLSDNQLSGTIPSSLNNLTNLTDPLGIQNNNYTFNELEPFLNSASISTTHAPQNKVGTEQTHTLSTGDSITLTVEVPENSSGHDSYQWYKDGQAISGATDRSYTISSFDSSYSGVYTYHITNSAVTDLTLESNNITLTDGTTNDDTGDTNTGADAGNSTDDGNNQQLPNTGQYTVFINFVVGMLFIFIGLLFYFKQIEFIAE